MWRSLNVIHSYLGESIDPRGGEKGQFGFLSGYTMPRLGGDLLICGDAFAGRVSEDAYLLTFPLVSSSLLPSFFTIID